MSSLLLRTWTLERDPELLFLFTTLSAVVFSCGGCCGGVFSLFSATTLSSEITFSEGFHSSAITPGVPTLTRFFFVSAATFGGIKVLVSSLLAGFTAAVTTSSPSFLDTWGLVTQHETNSKKDLMTLYNKNSHLNIHLYLYIYPYK